MESFDKKINETFNTDFPEVPEGFGWEENKNAIYSKMEEEEKPNKKVFLWWMWGSVSGLVIALLTFAIFYPYNTSNNYTQEVTVDSKNQYEKTISNQNVNSSDLDEISNDIIKTSTDKQISDNIGQKHSQNIKQSSKNTIPAKLQNNQAGQDYQYSQEKEVNTYRSDVDTQYQPTIDTNSSDKNSDSDLKVVSPLFKREMMIFPFLATKNFVISRFEDRLLFAHLVPSTQTEDDITNSPIKNSLEHALFLGGGTLLSSGKYNGIDNRNKYSKWLPGYHATVGYALENGKFGINIYYDHNFAVQLFDFQSQDSVKVPQSLETTVTEVYTKRTRNFSSIQSVKTPRNRDYTTYNTFRSHSLGLTLLYKILESDKFSIQTGIGGRYSLINNTSGYTLLANGEIASYTASKSIYSSNRFDINGTIIMSYDLNEKISVAPYVRWNRTVTNRSIESDVSLNGSQVLAGVGVSIGI